MSRERRPPCNALLGIPYPHTLIHAPGRKQRRVTAPRHTQCPSRMPSHRLMRRPRLRVPDAHSVVPAPRRHPLVRRRRELRRQYRLPVARDAIGHARDGLDFEHRLWLRGERDGRLEGVAHAVAAQELEEVAGPGVDDDIRVGDVDAEAIRKKVFAILYPKSSLIFCNRISALTGRPLWADDACVPFQAWC